MVRNISLHQMDSAFCEDISYGQKMNDVNRLKRNLTLDLHLDNNHNKRPKFSPAVTAAPVLSSPDVGKLKLTTPEIEKFLATQSGMLLTPTPNTTTQMLFPKSVTDEQELYTTEFVDALNDFHNNSSRLQVELPKSSSSSNSSVSNFISIDNQYPVTLASNYGIVMSPTDGGVVIKDEPQTVPSLGSSPPLSPINMENQEKIKLERKRMRNRVAASKCRRRKLERIARLEDKVKLLKGENNELGQIVVKLKEEVCSLKQKVLKHVNNGCHIMVSSNF